MHDFKWFYTVYVPAHLVRLCRGSQEEITFGHLATLPVAIKLTLLNGSIPGDDPHEQGLSYGGHDKALFVTLPVEDLHQHIPIGQDVRGGKPLTPNVSLQTMG